MEGRNGGGAFAVPASSYSEMASSPDLHLAMDIEESNKESNRSENAATEGHTIGTGTERPLWAQQVEQRDTIDINNMRCSLCNRWIPKKQVKCITENNFPFPGDWGYTYHCLGCAQSRGQNSDFFEWKSRSWMDVVQIATYNLTVQKVEEGYTRNEALTSDSHFFIRFKEDICAFLDNNWERLCIGKSRTLTWHNTIGSALSSHPDTFVSGFKAIGQHGYWGMKHILNPAIGRDTRPSKAATKLSSKTRKRKATDSAAGAKTQPTKQRKTRKQKQKQKATRSKPKPPPVEWRPPPKRYYEPDYSLYTTLCIAKENSARQVKIFPDLLTVENPKGYRMARASFGATEGCWYFEIYINPHEGNTRLGWSTEKGDLQAPVGYDKYSYSYRDKAGDIFHQSRGRPYGEPYGSNDIIGFLIYLPPPEQASSTATSQSPSSTSPAADSNNSTNGVTNSSTTHSNTNASTPPAEPKQEPNTSTNTSTSSDKKEEVLPVLNGSCLIFYKNGVSQGIAFKDIFAGTYYPAASLYNSANVTFNFGPEFKCPPQDCPLAYRPWCELAPTPEQLEAEKKRKEEAVAQEQNDVMVLCQQQSPSPPSIKLKLEPGKTLPSVVTRIDLVDERPREDTVTPEMRGMGPPLVLDEEEEEEERPSSEESEEEEQEEDEDGEFEDDDFPFA